VFTDEVSAVFSRVVSVAEKTGKRVNLLVVPGTDPNYAMVETAARLRSSNIVMGLSPRFRPSQQAKLIGDAWEKLPPPRPQISLEVIDRDSGKSLFFNLGPHPPRLWPDDVDLVHRLWLELSATGPGHKVRHRDVVRVALRRLDSQMKSGHFEEIARDLAEETGGSGEPRRQSEESA
jgi:hypothetical protein